MIDDRAFEIIKYVATHGCIVEDHKSQHYCQYCKYEYGNVDHYDPVPHKEDCVYIAALELFGVIR